MELLGCIKTTVVVSKSNERNTRNMHVAKTKN